MISAGIGCYVSLPDTESASDFSLTTSMVTFGSGDISGSSKCFVFDLTEDLILECDEEFDVEITGAGGASFGAQSTAVVTIEDNDG